MSRRTTEAYESVFKYITEKLIPLRGEAIIIDFEKAMRKALIQILKSIDSHMSILGCWFHMCQALRRKLSKLPDLFQKVRSDEKYKNIFRRFQCLALLPLHHIASTFKDLCKDALKLDKDSFAPFVNYFNEEWMRIVTPYHFCVFMRGCRTTAAAEAINGKMNKLFKTHGGFYLFCETLQKLEASTSTQLQNYVNGTQQKDTRKAFYKKRSKLIAKLQRDHKDNPKLLLNALANPKNKTLYEDNEIDVEDVDLTADTEMYGNENNVIYKEILDLDSNDDVSDIENEAITTRSRKDKSTAVPSSIDNRRATRVMTSQSESGDS